MWEPGHTIQNGKYRIERQLGGGGFGITYLAENVQLGHKVVIKVPNKTYEQDQDYEKFTRRFQREGQALAKIQHPNVVRVIDLGNEAGMPCLIMEHIEGETLSKRVRQRGKLSQDEAVPIFRQIAKTLHELHRQGIIHCDLHPGNIILESGGKPVLIDFGSAKFLQPMTRTVTTTHNENYTPYEQRRKASKPESRWDVYALAATLYFTVTGQKPNSAFDRKAFDEELKAPKDCCPALSPWFNQAILQGMALEPEERIASMQAWLGMLHPPKLPAPEPVVSQTAPLSDANSPENQPSHQHVQFPWVSLLFLALGYVPHGVIISLSQLTNWTTAFAWTGAVAWAGSGIWPGALTVAVAGAVIFAGFVAVSEAATWILIWAVAWASAVAVTGTVTWIKAGRWKYKNIATIIFLSLPLIMGSIAGQMIGSRSLLGLGMGTVALTQLVTTAYGLFNSREILGKQIDQLNVFFVSSFVSTLGIAVGVGLGWWLRLSGFQLPGS
ncbi:MAG: serine/threonine-protein kinase [Cyanobacteria bacterium P01_G01_bin.54]